MLPKTRTQLTPVKEESTVEPRVVMNSENVRLEKDHSNAWCVKGLMRNKSIQSVKGSVKIKCLNSRGDVVQTYRAYCNQGDPISPGQAGNFEYCAAPSDFSGVEDYQILFVEK